MIIERGEAVKLIVSAAVLALVSSSALAETAIPFPVTIPMECVDLAQRQNVPVVLENKYQAVKARVKLARLRDSEPNVHECRAAIARAQVALGFSD